MTAFRASVACGEGGTRYSPSDWGDMYSVKVGEMVSLAGMQTGAWDGPPGGGGRSVGDTVGIVVGAIVALVIFCELTHFRPRRIAKHQATLQMQQRAVAPPGSMPVASGVAMTPTAGGAAMPVATATAMPVATATPLQPGNKNEPMC
jgi:hypothetical protein